MSEQIFEKYPIFRNEKMKLCEITEGEDISAFFTYPLTKAQMLWMVKIFQQQYKKQEQITLGIYIDSTLVGLLQLKKKQAEVFEIGYHIKKEYRNKGYMKQAIQLLINNIHDAQIKVIEAYVHASNSISKHLLECCGFLQGINKNGVLIYRYRMKE